MKIHEPLPLQHKTSITTQFLRRKRKRGRGIYLQTKIHQTLYHKGMEGFFSYFKAGLTLVPHMLWTNESATEKVLFRYSKLYTQSTL